MRESKLDYWIQLVIDLATNPCGAMTLSEFRQILRIVNSRGTSPPGLRASLRRLGYQFDDDKIIGLSARTIEHYLRSYVGSDISVDDVLLSVRPGVERRYVAHLLNSLPADRGVLTHYALI